VVIGTHCSDGRPVTGVVVQAVDQDLRQHEPVRPYAPDFVRDARTDGSGYYEIANIAVQRSWTEDDTADLIVKVFEFTGTVGTSSPIHFNAPPEATLNLVFSGGAA
jgi:hypothetical protein